MKNAYKIIVAGMALLLASCSENPENPEGAGVTTEPNASKQAKLTEEQMEILQKSFAVLIDTAAAAEWGQPESLIDSIIYDPTITLDSNMLAILNLSFPFYTSADQYIHHGSVDQRWSCNVGTFPEESGASMDQKYDAHTFASHGSGSGVFEGFHAMRIVYVDSVPVIMKTVGSTDYWGFGVSCEEFLEQFKDTCEASNGIFRDFYKGCEGRTVELACSMMVPEDMDVKDAVEIFKDEYQNACREDSIRYAPADEPEFGIQGCTSVGKFDLRDGVSLSYSNCIPRTADPTLDSMSRDWQRSLTRTLDDYWRQFTDTKPDDILSEPDLLFGDMETFSSFVAYNTFPSAEAAEAYREEGVYPLPDSLLEVFFPKIAESPTAFKVLERRNAAYYIIVIEDVGTKGHILREIGDENIRITDIVKSGESCPEDTAVHYSAYLVRGTDNWELLEKSIVKKTFVSPLWNCDDPESLERIEPYGEWVNRFGVM